MACYNFNASGARLGRRAVLVGLGCGVALAARPAWARPERERSVNLVCPETGECFSEVYWHGGLYLPDAMRRIDWLMRDFHRDAVAEIDPALVDLLHRIAIALGTRRPIGILSGYRTRATNAKLRHEGMPAARKSQHLIARAADIAIDGVAVARLHRAALNQSDGGVGAYDDYVHVDTGPRREWLLHRRG